MTKAYRSTFQTSMMEFFAKIDNWEPKNFLPPSKIVLPNQRLEIFP